jgi:hypothetical protein
VAFWGTGHHAQLEYDHGDRQGPRQRLGLIDRRCVLSREPRERVPDESDMSVNDELSRREFLSVADTRRRSGVQLGALHGLPIPVKDSVNTRDKGRPLILCFCG